MQAHSIVPRQEYRLGSGDDTTKVREVLTGAGVRRVTVSDTHGHTIIEVPVKAEDVGLVMEPVLAATKAVQDTVGEVVLSVESEGELTGRTSGGQQQAQGTGGQQAQAGGQQQAATVTQEDIERIRKANAVPTATRQDVERIAPEQKGEPELKDTGEWPDARQDGK